MLTEGFEMQVLQLILFGLLRPLSKRVVILFCMALQSCDTRAMFVIM